MLSSCVWTFSVMIYLQKIYENTATNKKFDFIA